MKKLLIPATCILALALGVTNAAAAPISTSDTNYLGSVDPGAPADSDAEAAYITYLVNMTSPDTDNDVDLFGNGKLYDFVRSSNSCGACPDASATGAGGDDSFSGGTIDASGFTYLLVKFGNESHVWYIPGFSDPENVEIPTGLGSGLGTSHYSLFNPTTTTTPDGGATLGLLGLGILGLGYLRRRLG